MATKRTDIKCIEGVYYETNTAGDAVSYRFTAEKLLWIPVKGTDSGGYSTVSSATTPSTTQFSVADGSQFSANNVIIVELSSGDEARIIQTVATNLVTVTVALSVAPVAGNKVRAATCKAYVKRVSDGKYAYADSDGKTQYTAVLATGLQYLSLRYDWTNYETGVSEDLRCYLDGIDPTTANNPCEIEIISGLTNDQHVVRIERLTNTEAGATNYLRHNCFFLIGEDIEYPREWFKSGSSTTTGTIMALPDMNEGGSDIRNSFTVIGSRIMTEVPGTELDRIINPNNPEYRFVSSKSVDVKSIYYPSAVNYTGRERKSVIIHDAIKSQNRADFLSLKSLRKYRLSRPAATFKAIGHPLIEFNDCISIEDQEKSTIEKTQKNWVVGINTTGEPKNFFMNFETTPFRPEQSYFTAPDMDITEYGDYPLVNLEITSGGRREEGSGTWASLGGGSYKLTDSTKAWTVNEWVNDGWGTAGGFDIYDSAWKRLRVTSNTLNTITASIASGSTTVNVGLAGITPSDIQFELANAVAFSVGDGITVGLDTGDETGTIAEVLGNVIRLVSALSKAPSSGDSVDITSYAPTSGSYYVVSTEGRYQSHPYDPYWSDESGRYINVKFDLLKSAWVDVQIRSWNGDTLIANLFDPQGEGDHYEKLVPDTYILKWDGVDWYGEWNERCGIQESRQYANDNIDTSIGRGFFCAELMDGGSRMTYSQFYVYIRVKCSDNNIYDIKSYRLGISNSANNKLGNQWLYLKRGDKVTGSLTITPALSQSGTLSLSPTAFWNNQDPDSKGYATGLKLAYQVTNATKRMVQKSIEIKPLVFGKLLDTLGAYYDLTDRSNFPVKERVDYSFKDCSNQKVEYFLPSESGYIYDSELMKVLARYKEHGQGNVSWYKIAWGFIFTLTFTDKSGRTSISRKYITYRHRDYQSKPYAVLYKGTGSVNPFQYQELDSGANSLGVVWATKIYP